MSFEIPIPNPNKEREQDKREDFRKKYESINAAMFQIEDIKLSGGKNLVNVLKESDDWATLEKEEDKKLFSEELERLERDIARKASIVAELKGKKDEDKAKERAYEDSCKKLETLEAKQNVLNAIAYINKIDFPKKFTIKNSIRDKDSGNFTYTYSRKDVNIEFIEERSFQKQLIDKVNGFYEMKNADLENENVYFSAFDKKKSNLLRHITERLEERIEEEKAERVKSSEQSEQQEYAASVDSGVDVYLNHKRMNDTQKGEGILNFFSGKFAVHELNSPNFKIGVEKLISLIKKGEFTPDIEKKANGLLEEYSRIKSFPEDIKQLIDRQLGRQAKKTEETPKNEGSEQNKENPVKSELQQESERYGEQINRHSELKSNLPTIISEVEKKIVAVEKLGKFVDEMSHLDNIEKEKLLNRIEGIQIINRQFKRLQNRFNSIESGKIAVPEITGNEEKDYYNLKDFRENSRKFEETLRSFIKDDLLLAYDGIDKGLSLIQNKEFDEKVLRLFDRYGITKTYEEMDDVFLRLAKNIGLEKIDVKAGDTFDQEKHTPLDTVKDESGIHKDEEIHSLGRSGFNYKGSHIRDAEVIVWKK